MNKEIIEELYINRRLTCKQISEFFYLTPTWIRINIKKLGFKTRGRSNILKEELIGKRFNKLLIVPSSNKKGWSCLCDCGNFTEHSLSSLKSGKSKSCGCFSKKSYKDISGKYLYSLKFSAKKRNLEFDLTPEYLWELLIKQNKKCALSGVPLRIKKDTKSEFNRLNTASLDRIDSSRGYTKDNVQWVHKEINWLKNDLSEKEFHYWVEKVYKYKNSNKK